MAVAKVILNNNTLMDATVATATASDIMSSKTAMLADGVMTTGTGSGGGGESEDNVIFIDYDGTVVESYTTAELLAMSALPSNPSHTGLTAQGWNWSLSDAKAYVTAYPNADLIIGQSYITTDGKTHFNICIESMFDVSIPFILKFANSVGANIEIDWGDGSSKAYATGTSETTPVVYSHVYASAGEYDVTLNVVSGTLIFYSYIYGTSSESNQYINRRRYRKAFIGNNVKDAAGNFSYTCLEEITIPTSFDFGAAGLSNFITACYRLKGFVLPNGITEIGNYLAQHCHLLEYSSLPNGVLSIGDYAFSYCYNIKKICIPSGITSISTSFVGNSGLKRITFPSAITSIGTFQFTSSTVNEVHLMSVNPPAASALTNIKMSDSSGIYYVPYSSDHSVLNAYKTATNWSTLADQIIEEPQT